MTATETQIITALEKHRNAAAAARELGISAHRAWRMSKKHNIVLIALAEHMRRRRRTPDFIRKFEATAAVRCRVLDEQRQLPSVRKRQAIAARAYMRELNRDPEIRKASSERMKRHYDILVFRKKQAAAAADHMRRLWSDDPAFRTRVSAAVSKAAKQMQKERKKKGGHNS